MNLNIPQILILITLIAAAIGIVFFMLILTWALASPKCPVSTRTAGKWIMLCLIAAMISYMLLVAISH